jgi:hypothetical protein
MALWKGKSWPVSCVKRERKGQSVQAPPQGSVLKELAPFALEVELVARAESQ